MVKTSAHYPNFNQVQSLASFYLCFLCSYYSSSLNSIPPSFFYFFQSVSDDKVSSPKSADELLANDCPLPRNHVSKQCNSSKPVLPIPPSSSNVTVTCNNSSISFFLINARSLCNKVSLLSSYMREYRPCIICITETWAHHGINDGYFSFPNYTLFRCDRSEGIGGGVMIFVLDAFQSNLVTKFSVDGAESISCRVSTPPSSVSTSLDLIVSCVYRPPSYPFHNSPLLEHLSNIASSNSSRYLVICGDFNCPEISWTDRGISLQDFPLAVWSLNHFLSQSVLVPTRPASQTILDLIFSTVSTPLEDVSVRECFGSSDHCLITFNILAPFVISPTIRKVHVYAKAKWSLYRKMLLKCNWPVTSACSVSEIWNVFRSNII